MLQEMKVGRPIDELEKLDKKLKEARTCQDPKIKKRLISEIRSGLSGMHGCAEVQKMLHSCDSLEQAVHPQL